jgi:hypothetical protein
MVRVVHYTVAKLMRLALTSAVQKVVLYTYCYCTSMCMQHNSLTAINYSRFTAVVVAVAAFEL